MEKGKTLLCTNMYWQLLIWIRDRLPPEQEELSSKYIVFFSYNVLNLPNAVVDEAAYTLM